jgi:DNA/RNA-binding domain of Phe-tRNA-synthetase-like protein
VINLALDAHPLLCLAALSGRFEGGVAAVAPDPGLAALLAGSGEPPLPPADESVRQTIRDLLRHGGFKPTGRSKPSSEYLVRAAAAGELRPINAAADVGNAVSLHSGIPISVVDADRLRPPLRVGIAPPGASFVFNAAGQVIDVGGLVGLADAEGPCANPVKDAQRTKTHPGTIRTLVLLWGHVLLAERVDAAASWAHALLERAGAEVEAVAQPPSDR